MRRGLLLLVFLSIIVVAQAVNFEQCLANFQTGTLANATIEDGRDNQGNPVSSFANATALTYLSCVQLCGGGSEPASWTLISQQFSAWLLPWLALLSQLPFGGADVLDNIGSIVLTVGSPTLAAYSLAITVMNGRWIAQYFQPIRSPTAGTAVRVLSRLQQSPLEVVAGPELISLVKWRQNDLWWEGMLKNLSVLHTWSISSGTSVLWVVIAYVFTVADSFSPDLTQSVNANGEGIGSQWLFLLAVVVGWLQLSPKCDAESVNEAFEVGEKMIYLDDRSMVDFELGFDSLEDASMSHSAARHPFQLLRDLLWQNSLRRDEFRVPSVFNYARVLPWTINVLKVADAFEIAEGRPDERPLWTRTEGGLWNSGISWRIGLSSFAALFLQWGTSGAAIVVAYLTPTIGIGCRTASFMIYGGVSTTIWFFLIISTFLTFSATQMYDPKVHPRPSRSQCTTRFLLKWSAITIRRLCTLAAILNTAWVIAFCFFQFTNFFDRCWCNSSVLQYGAKNAYNVIQFLPEDVNKMKQAWIGGAALGVGSVTVFVFFIASQLNPPIPKSKRR